MGFWVTTLIFLLAGVAASLFTLLCCNRGPSTNLYAPLMPPPSPSIRFLRSLTRRGALVGLIPFDLGDYSCNLLLDDVCYRLPCSDEAIDQPHPERGVISPLH
ncbi:hypothetical protein ZEAMMB73_Zm00001d045497 [Zea mays]|uniref:Uncharacterized protein n=1 Tax=Zea mays TaxID=4577 RepID=A0A1D6NWB8_MAIZE|nr:hypothetical protein ZEAMMB73_Zm00001d045497 [Zea mays]